MALGVQVGHVVAHRASAEGSLLYTVFTKKCQKRAKRGYPLFLPVFGEACGHFGPRSSEFRLEVRKRSP